MSQYTRRVLAALGLIAAMLLAAPPPSRAAGLRELPSVAGFAARAWTWLEDLLPYRLAARGEKQEVATKTAGTVISPTAPPPTGISEEGSAIDPNGRH
ncbi:MAG: hypothetical protein ABIS20_25050 [Thermoanaerobaculia bacterium]